MHDHDFGFKVGRSWCDETGFVAVGMVLTGLPGSYPGTILSIALALASASSCSELGFPWLCPEPNVSHAYAVIFQLGSNPRPTLAAWPVAIPVAMLAINRSY